MYEYYRRVLHAVREGLLLLDDDGRVQLVNDEARRLLDLPDDVGRPSARRPRPGARPGGGRARAAGRRRRDLPRGDRVLVVSSAPARWEGRDGRHGGDPARPHRAAVGHRASWTWSAASPSRCAPRPTRRPTGCTPWCPSSRWAGRRRRSSSPPRSSQVAQLLTDRVVGAVGDPVLAALLLGKTAEAAERGIELVVDRRARAGRRRPVPRPGDRARQPGRQRVRRRGRPAEDRRVRVDLAGGADGADARASATAARGSTPRTREHALERGWTTKASGDGGRGLGLALVGQVARRHGGAVDVGRSDLGGAEFTVDARRGRDRDDRAGAGRRGRAAGRRGARGVRRAGRRASRSPGSPGRRRGARGSCGSDTTVDLVLLDMHLPDGHGLGLRPAAAGRRAPRAT